MQHIEENTLAELRTQLETEQQELRESLEAEGRIIDEKGDWAAVPPEADTSEEDHTVQADRMEEFFNRGGSIAELEVRYANVSEALARMDAGTYGLSGVSGDPIEVERLQANPAATTTIAEMQSQPAEGQEKLS